MSFDRIAQPILIADDLLAQYRAIVARMHAVPKDANMADSFSNMIGEANQVYTGVWEHLDEAAVGLDGAGRGVSRYAQMRAEHGHLGILDSGSSTAVALGASLVRGGLVTQTSVSAKPNHAGAEAAAELLALFKSNLPEFDWEGARRAAEAPPEDISSSTGKYLGMAVALAVAALVAYLILR